MLDVMAILPKLFLVISKGDSTVRGESFPFSKMKVEFY